MRICTTCGNNKKLSCYCKDKTKPDGLYTICKECLKEKRNEKKEDKRKYDIEYRLKNYEKLKEIKKIYQKTLSNNVRAAYNKKYRQEHKDKFNKWQLDYIKKNKYKFVYRALLNNFIVRSKKTKNDTIIKILGYDFNKFKQRIEMNFKEGMCWENHGSWHIDHKKPISKFKEGTSPKIVNSLCNLQPLWAEENLSKGNKFKIS